MIDNINLINIGQNISQNIFSQFGNDLNLAKDDLEKHFLRRDKRSR